MFLVSWKIFGIVILMSDENHEKAFLPISMTLFGIITFACDGHSKKV